MTGWAPRHRTFADHPGGQVFTVTLVHKKKDKWTSTDGGN